MKTSKNEQMLINLFMRGVAASGSVFTLAVGALILTVTWTAPALAQPDDGGASTERPPKSNRINRICHYIESKSRDTTPNTPYEYDYQRIIYPAAGVSDDEYENGPEEEISRKVRLLWKNEIRHQRCGPMGVPSTGDPLRFAVHTSFDEFITEAISLWKIDLNYLSDDQTILDWIEWRISRAIGLQKEKLEEYRKSFILMGAKRRSEL